MSDNKTKETVGKLVTALTRKGGEDSYAYASGYLSSVLTDIIDRYVPEDKRVMVQIELLGMACDVAIGNIKRDAPAA